ncbi:MAG: hypothetical protein KDD35_05640 [Bdellovibrionales bacterium]|nr:hypothetical protein [Bdellovibrionales bacterium]
MDFIDIVDIQMILESLKTNLHNRQTQELGAYLRFIIGHDMGENVDPYQFAREKSHQNLNRLLEGEKEVQNSTEFRIALKLVSRGLRRFRHNLVEAPKSNQKTPMWLSSEQIELLGLRGGLQSLLSFNRDLLKTHNWIFFFVGQDNDKAYGNDEIFVKGEYASHYGFIFPFIMDIGDLASAGVFMNEPAGAPLTQLFETR